MRRLILAGVAGAALVGVCGPAGAVGMGMGMAVSPRGEAGIIQVEGGCGPGRFRADNGRCYPMRRPPPPPEYGRPPPPPEYRRPPPPDFDGPRCPPGLRPGPGGRCFPD